MGAVCSARRRSACTMDENQFRQNFDTQPSFSGWPGIQSALPKATGSADKAAGTISNNSEARENLMTIPERAPPYLMASTPEPKPVPQGKRHSTGRKPTVPPKPKSTAPTSTTVGIQEPPADNAADDIPKLIEKSDSQVTSPESTSEDAVNLDETPNAFKTCENTALQSQDALPPKASTVETKTDIEMHNVRKLIEVFEGIDRKSQKESTSPSAKFVKHNKLCRTKVLEMIIGELNDMYRGRAMGKERYEKAWAALAQLLKVFED